MKATDQFHVGIVVDDLDAALAELTELFGYQWCPQMAVRTPVLLATGETELDLRFTYSATTPRVEVIQSRPGTLWIPASGSHIHHLGYWSDDVAADAVQLAERGHRGGSHRRPPGRHAGLGLPQEPERTPHRAGEPADSAGPGAVLGCRQRTVAEPVTVATRSSVDRGARHFGSALPAAARTVSTTSSLEAPGPSTAATPSVEQRPDVGRRDDAADDDGRLEAGRPAARRPRRGPA